MITTNKISRVLCVSLALSGIYNTITYASPGNLEAINSASDDLRNIVGIEISTATPAQKAAVNCEEGAFVSAVIPKHPAAASGLKAGDIITKIDGKAVQDHSEALTVMNGLDAGRRYSFDVCRVDAGGNPQKLTISILVEKVTENVIGKIS